MNFNTYFLATDAKDNYANTPAPAHRPSKRIRRASSLTPDQLDRLLDYVEKTSSVPESDTLKILLSFRAGLRVSEIATLTLDDVTDAEGRFLKQITINAANAKNGRSRSIPMHPAIHSALVRFRRAFPTLDVICLSKGSLGLKRQSTKALTVWFHRLYRQVGFDRCSSHSGRRTFISELSRRANQFGNSLRDVQRIAGHVRLDTTAAYIDFAPDVADLVASLGKEADRQEDVVKSQSPVLAEGGL